MPSMAFSSVGLSWHSSTSSSILLTSLALDVLSLISSTALLPSLDWQLCSRSNRTSGLRARSQAGSVLLRVLFLDFLGHSV